MTGASSQPTPVEIEASAVPVARCADCGFVITGNYCAHCGQETHIVTPSVREFLREFLQDQIALEGKLLRTLRVMVLKPGQLTLDYVAGVRQRYIRPLRLYLTFSVIFFAVLGFGGGPDSDDDQKPSSTEHAQQAGESSKEKDSSKKAAGTHDQSTPQTPEVAKPPMPPSTSNPADETKGGTDTDDDKSSEEKSKRTVTKVATFDNPEELKEMQSHLKTGSAFVDRKVEHLFSQFGQTAHPEQSLTQAMRNEAPIAMFFLLPFFAALLKLAYWRRHLRYGVHILFALHLHAFAFFDFALARLPLPGIVGTALNVWLFAYLVMSLRRVYGGGKVSTSFGALFLCLVYAIAILSVMFTAGLMSLIFTG